MSLLFLLLILITVPVKAADPESESVGYIFIGDSRTVGISQAVDEQDNVFFVAEVGQGYKWFCSTAVDQVAEIIDSHDYIRWVLISNLGVNDLGNASKYEAKYKELCQDEWAAYDFYIMSVMCIDEDKYSGSVTNKAIEKFNSQMQYYRKYIDIFDISKKEIISKDGLHYRADVYAKLYDEVFEHLE